MTVFSGDLESGPSVLHLSRPGLTLFCLCLMVFKLLSLFLSPSTNLRLSPFVGSQRLKVCGVRRLQTLRLLGSFQTPRLEFTAIPGKERSFNTTKLLLDIRPTSFHPGSNPANLRTLPQGSWPNPLPGALCHL